MNPLFCRIFLCLTLVACALVGLPAVAQEGPLENSTPKNATPEEIIQHFAAKEKEFKQARDQYTYRQDVRVMTVDGDTVTGEYHEVYDVLFDDNARPIENVLFPPQSTPKQATLPMTQR